jgi:Interferon-alpha/beta receptor, fibronectin type III
MTRSRFFTEAVLLIACLFLLAVGAFAQTANTATIEFTAPTKRLDNTTITGALSYKVYQGIKGQSKALVGTITTTTSTITTGLLGGTEYCFQVSANEGTGPESALSNEACKVFAVAGVTPVTITVR